MKKVLLIAAVAEDAMGLALLIAPSLVGRLLLGEELGGVAIPVARVLGIALIALGVACWPGPPRIGMLTYGAAIALYLAYLGVVGGYTGILLWPGVVLHAILTALLAWAPASTKRSNHRRIRLRPSGPIRQRFFDGFVRGFRLRPRLLIQPNRRPATVQGRENR